MARKPKSGPKSSSNPQREEFTAFRAKLLHGHRDWKMMRFQVLIREHEKQFGSRLTDNYLSERASANVKKGREKGYVLLDEIDALWREIVAGFDGVCREIVAGFEQAVLDGDADWFKRQADWFKGQAKAIRTRDTRSKTDKALDQFEAAVARALEMSFWWARTEEKRRNPNMEGATLEPAGKHAGGVTAQQVLNVFKQREVRRLDGSRHLFVEVVAATRIEPAVECRFESKRRSRRSQFLEARIIPQRIEHQIEPEQRRSERCADV